MGSSIRIDKSVRRHEVDYYHGVGNIGMGCYTVAPDDTNAPYATANEAIAAAVADGCSASNPKVIWMKAGDHLINETIVAVPGLIIMAIGARLVQNVAAPIIQFHDATDAEMHCHVYGAQFVQATPASGKCYPCILLGVDYSPSVVDASSCKYVFFHNCVGYGTAGPFIAGSGHEVYWYGGGVWIVYAAGTGDVCLSDGCEDSVNGKNWVSMGVPSFGVDRITPGVIGEALAQFRCKINATAGSTDNTDLAYINLPYVSPHAVGSQVDTFAAFVKIAVSDGAYTPLAGEFSLLLKSAVDGGGDTLATIDLPAWSGTTGNYRHILQRLTAEQMTALRGATVKSVVFHQNVSGMSNTLTYFGIDDAWLQTGYWGQHEHVMIKCLYNNGAWMGIESAVIEPRNYQTNNAIAAGHSFGLIVTYNQLAFDSLASAGSTGLFRFNNCDILVRANGTPAVGNAPQIAKLATSGAGSEVQINNPSPAAVEITSGSNARVHPLEALIGALGNTSYGIARVKGGSLKTAVASASLFTAAVGAAGGSSTSAVRYGALSTLHLGAASIPAETEYKFFGTADGEGLTEQHYTRVVNVRASGLASDAGTLTITTYIDGVAQSNPLVLTATGAERKTGSSGYWYGVPPSGDLAFSAVASAGGNWSQVSVQVIREDLTTN